MALRAPAARDGDARGAPAHRTLARRARGPDRGGRGRASAPPHRLDRLFRTEARLEAALDEARRLARFGLAYDALDARALREREPHLSDAAVGAIHLRDTAAIVDPGALSKALLALFERRGGLFVQGDARTLARDGAGWTVTTAAGPLAGRDAVVALGAWSDRVTRPLGLRIPLAVKRGYHMHYRPAGNAVLHAPVLDAERGYVLAPMARGLRLTTGAEFARADAPPTPVQVTRAEAAARELLPLAERLDPAPWMGARPCLPDMLPVIGPAPGHPGLWLLFGHAHHGLTLGPVTGRLLAEMIVGEAPFTDPAPYRADRF